jgi:hypothetical protein
MKPVVTLQLDEDTVRFTPDGSIAVVDAIGVLSQSPRPERIWNALRRDHPETTSLCTDFKFSGDQAASVADSEGWEVIQALLLDHLLETDPD